MLSSGIGGKVALEVEAPACLLFLLSGWMFNKLVRGRGSFSFFALILVIKFFLAEHTENCLANLLLSRVHVTAGGRGACGWWQGCSGGCARVNDSHRWRRYTNVVAILAMIAVPCLAADGHLYTLAWAERLCCEDLLPVWLSPPMQEAPEHPTEATDWC